MVVKVARGITPQRITVIVKKCWRLGIPDAVFGLQLLISATATVPKISGSGCNGRGTYPVHPGDGEFDYRREEDLHNAVGTEGRSWRYFRSAWFRLSAC